MPDTPERDIEKQLRQHAEQRRAAAGGASLHPATRRLLQAEARRQWGGRRAGRPRAGWWRRFGPRLAFAVGMLALLGVAAALLFNLGGNQATNFAKLDERAPAAVPGDAEGALAFADDAGARPATEDVVAGGALTGGPTPTPAPASAAGSASRAFSAADTLAAREVAPVSQAQFFGGTTLAARPDGQVGESRMKVAAAAAGTLGVDAATDRPQSGMFALTGQAAPGVTQAFRNAAIPEGERAVATDVPPVLNHFTVAQDGDTLTVVDEDGSVYRGNVVPLPEATAEGVLGFATRDGGLSRATATATAPVTTRAEPGGEVAQGWQFQVEGTNLSLRQRVVFNGQFWQNAPPALANNARNFQRQAPMQADMNAPGRAATQDTLNHFIQGRVQVGNQRETELNAIPVGP